MTVYLRQEPMCCPNCGNFDKMFQTVDTGNKTRTPICIGSKCDHCGWTNIVNEKDRKEV